MIRKTRLFTPGPTPLLPAAQFAMAAADMHHRTPEFRALFQKVLAQLKVFVGTKNDVLLLACSGTGAMEASVSNLTSPGDQVLVLTAGKFGERWVDLAKAFGCQPDVVKAPYGQTFDLAAVRAALKPEHKAVYMQATETSTAVRHDVEAVAKLREEIGAQHAARGRRHHRPGHDALRRGRLGHRRPDRRLAEGGDDSAGPGLPERERERVGGDGDGQESALLLRPAQGAQERREGRERLHAGGGAGCGLGAALDYIAGQAGGDLEKGRIALIDNAQVNAAATRAGLVALGFTLFAPTAPAAAATAVAVPEGMDSGEVVKALKAKFALVTANGQGEMQGKIFRVAHLGFFDYLDTVALLGAMEHIAKDTLGLPVEYGQAVAAAQKVYAKAVKQ